MHAFYCDHFVLPLPEGHRFPMAKYRLLRERVRQSLPGMILEEPAAASSEELLLVHTPAYVARVLEGDLDRDEIRRIGFPWSPELTERSRRSVGGTIAAARMALAQGAAANLAGGTHHAFSDRGEGFCVFNDVAVGIRTLQFEGAVDRACVIDLDVHQGNGTARIFEEEPRVFTASVHGANNFPFKKTRSDLDLPLPDGADDHAFLASVRMAVEAALGSRPDVAFYVAGADAYHGDRLGRLAVTKEGLAVRDEIVVGACRRAQVPLVVVMSGGYAESISDTVDIHLNSIATLSTAVARAA